MADALRLPDRLAERARDISEGRVEAAAPRDAATVILLRDSTDGPLVYLLRRVSSMKFAPGAYVFPGGSVDRRDGDLDVAWSGPSPAEWGAAFGAGETIARELVCAAVRETFEESGVLLAGPAEDAPALSEVLNARPGRRAAHAAVPMPSGTGRSRRPRPPRAPGRRPDGAPGRPPSSRPVPRTATRPGRRQPARG